jgi:hypothetical protein
MLVQTSKCYFRTYARNSGLLKNGFRGDVALLSNVNITVPDAPWYLHNLWTNGHVGVVRSLLFDEEVRGCFLFWYWCDQNVTRHLSQNRVIVTGGEDSKINIWPRSLTEVHTEDDSMDVDSSSRKRGLDREDEHVRVPWY